MDQVHKVIGLRELLCGGPGAAGYCFPRDMFEERQTPVAKVQGGQNELQ